jgi:hypothetical protein
MAQTLSIIGLIVSLIALAVSGMFAWRHYGIEPEQAQLARDQAAISNAQPLAIDLLREFREHSADRRCLYRELPAYPSNDGFESIDDPELPQLAVSTSHWYDNVGALVAHKMVDPTYIAGFLGQSELDMWNLLERFILAERRTKPHGDYGDYFEFLVRVRLLSDLNPAELRRRVIPDLYSFRSATAPDPFATDALWEGEPFSVPNLPGQLMFADYFCKPFQ